MASDFWKNWSLKVDAAPSIRQCGAIPYSVVDGRVAFLLITARRSGRWIFPKGAIDPGLTPQESAALEALEEAGVSGQIWGEPIGSYRSSSSDNSSLVDIDAYPLLVETQLDVWKEMDQRLRHWVMLPEAKRLLNDPALSRLAVKLDDQLREQHQLPTRNARAQ
jgi:8-oxo-dGTP pyrophosphatase MutT (NUDIX family)